MCVCVCVLEVREEKEGKVFYWFVSSSFETLKGGGRREPPLFQEQEKN